MKRPWMPAVLLVLLLTACNTAPQTESEPEAAPTETIAQTEAETPVPTAEPETAPPAAAAEQYTGEPHVFDECGVLDADALAHYNTYLDNLANSRLICTAAVITGSLNGAAPEAFAKEYYRSLYGTESGFLVLINNDTGQDVIYREGVCETYITGTALPVAQATPHLVTCDFAGALDILLPVGEMIPEKVFDRSGTLNAEQLQALLELAQADPEKNCVYLAYGIGKPDAAEPPEQVLAEYAEETRSRLGAQNLLLISTQQKLCVIAGGPPELLASEVQEVWRTQGIMEAVAHYYTGLNAKPEETAEKTADTSEAAETENTEETT